MHDSCADDAGSHAASQFVSIMSAASAAAESAGMCAASATELLKQVVANPSSTEADKAAAEQLAAEAAVAAQQANHKLADSVMLGSDMDSSPCFNISGVTTAAASAEASAESDMNMYKQQLLDLLSSPLPTSVATPPQEGPHDQWALWACLKQQYSVKKRLQWLLRFLQQERGHGAGGQGLSHSTFQLAKATARNLHWLGKSFLNGHKVGDSWVSRDEQVLLDIKLELLRGVQHEDSIMQQEPLSAQQLSRRTSAFKQLLLNYKLQSILSVPEELAKLDATLSPAQKKAGQRAYHELCEQRAATATLAARPIASIQGVNEHHPLVASWAKKILGTTAVQLHDFLQWPKDNHEQIWYDIANSSASRCSSLHRFQEEVSVMVDCASLIGTRSSSPRSSIGSHGRSPARSPTSHSGSSDVQQHRVHSADFWDSVSHHSSARAGQQPGAAKKPRHKGGQAAPPVPVTKSTSTLGKARAPAAAAQEEQVAAFERATDCQHKTVTSPSPNSSFSSNGSVQSPRAGSMVARPRSQLGRGCMVARSFHHEVWNADFNAGLAVLRHKYDQDGPLEHNDVTADEAGY